LRAAQASLLHAQKMAALGQLTAGIAHEIKNPLNFVNNFAGISIELLDALKEAAAPAVALLGEDTRAEIDEIVEMLSGNLVKIAQHGSRADGIVKSMLAHSRGSSGNRQQVDINALVEEALNLAYHGARAQDQNFNITLERELDADTAPIELVPQDVTRVFLNLFGNGFYAADKRRRDTGEPSFRPKLRVTTRDLGEAARSACATTASASRPNFATSYFSRFSRPSPPAKELGSACRSAETSSPRSTAERSRSTAKLARLPSSQSACRGPGRPQWQGGRHEFQHSRRRRRARCRRSVSPALSPRGTPGHLCAAFRRLRRGGAATARPRDRAAAHRHPVRHQHARNDGLTLLREIKHQRPDLPVMMVTAYGDDERRRHAAEAGALRFLSKPVDFDFLKGELSRLPGTSR
jgi:hypothetical protein